MTKRYLTQNFIKFSVVILVCFVLIFLNPKGILNSTRTIFLETAYPFQKALYLLGRMLSDTGEFLGSIGDIKRENAELLKENNILYAQIALLESEKKENELLREQLNLVPRQKFDLESAFVIGQDPQRLDSWLAIDKGSVNGVQPEMPVIVSEGILVGRISEVTPHTARVILLSDSTSVVNVIDKETGAKGILRGEFGLGVVMNMVSQQESINNNDTIITSGLGGNFPRGLLIGKIQEVRSTGDQLFQQAVINPRIKYSKLNMVFVIKN